MKLENGSSELNLQASNKLQSNEVDDVRIQDIDL